MKYLSLVSACLLLVSATSSAQTLSASSTLVVQQVGGVSCRLDGAQWRPGIVNKKGAFVSRAQKIRVIRRKVKAAISNTARSRLTKQLRRLRKLAKAEKKVCSSQAVIPNPVQIPTPVPDTQPVYFDLSNSTAIGLADPVAPPPAARGLAHAPPPSSQSNLRKVDSSGNVRDAIVAGTATVDRFLIGPNGKVYLLFSAPANIDGKGADCVLAEVDPRTGSHSCIEKAVNGGHRLVWQSPEIAGLTRNTPIQFDASGAAHYLVWQGGNVVLRRSHLGASTDLTPPLGILDFLALPDGSFLLYGVATLQSYWLRRFAPDGALTEIATFAGCSGSGSGGLNFLRRLQTGQVVAFLADCAYQPGVYEIDLNLWRLQEPAITPARWEDEVGEWLYQGTGMEHLAVLSPAEIIALARVVGFRAETSVPILPRDSLVRLYPTAGFVNTLVRSVRLLKPFGQGLFLAGTDQDGVQTVSFLDLLSESEQRLLPPDLQVEVYSVSPMASGTQILFDGLRFSDTSYVVGQIDLVSGALNMVAAGPRLRDLQVF
jgi:hypothetical protein